MTPHLTLDDRSDSRAEISLHGGQVTSWTHEGREYLYLSRRARFEAGESIRGGIPVVFPQFGREGPLPQHGLLRTREWSVAKQDDARATLRISDDAETLALWPHRFQAELLVSLEKGLEVHLKITNTDTSPFSFTAALHTYFAVDDVKHARVFWLTNERYLGKARSPRLVADRDPALRITGAIDRVYTLGPRFLRLGGLGARHDLDLEIAGFGDWVVWNPWAEETATLSDMEPDDYRRMLCVEAARIANPVTLEPGETWTGTKKMRLVRGA